MKLLILGTRQAITSKLCETAVAKYEMPQPWFVMTGSKVRETTWVQKQFLVVQRNAIPSTATVLVLDNITAEDFPTQQQLANIQFLVVATHLPTKLTCGNFFDTFDVTWVAYAYGSEKQKMYYQYVKQSNMPFQTFKDLLNRFSSEKQEYFESVNTTDASVSCETTAVSSSLVDNPSTVVNDLRCFESGGIPEELSKPEIPLIKNTNKENTIINNTENSRFPKEPANSSVIDVEIKHKVPEFDVKTTVQIWCTFRVKSQEDIEPVLVSTQEFLAQSTVHTMFPYASYDRDDQKQDLHFYFQVERVYETLFVSLLHQHMRGLKASDRITRAATLL